MKRKVSDYVMVIVGILLTGGALLLLKLDFDIKKSLEAFPYLFVGVGCGMFGHGMGNIINRKVLDSNPSIKKQQDIESKDERNIIISNRAKAKAYDVMVFVFGAVLFSFALMNVDMIVILLLVFVYLFIIGCEIYYRSKYFKEM